MMPEYLRSTFFYSACFITLVVFAVLIYALMTFKKKDYSIVSEEPNIKIELLWTIVPFVMIALMLFPVVKAYFQKSQTEKSNVLIIKGRDV